MNERIFFKEYCKIFSVSFQLVSKFSYEFHGTPLVGQAQRLAKNTTCALLANGSIFCWGKNNYELIGDGW